MVSPFFSPSLRQSLANFPSSEASVNHGKHTEASVTTDEPGNAWITRP